MNEKTSINSVYLNL